jgi:hypothetical protein
MKQKKIIKTKKSDGFQVVYDNYSLREEMIWEWVCDKIEMLCENIEKKKWINFISSDLLL